MAVLTGSDLLNDILIGGNADDTISGLGGDDTLKGNNGEDNINGGQGNDTVDGDNADDFIVGGAGNDVLRGSNGKDNIAGMGGNDTIDGGNGDDFLGGGNGNDIVKGGNGNDIMGGDAPVASNPGGADTLTGGRGADEFGYVSQAHSSLALGTMDVITDFTHLEDMIVLQGLGVTDTGVVNQDVAAFQSVSASDFFSPGTAVVVQHSGGEARAYFDLGVDGRFDPTEDLVILLSTDPGYLSAADFVFR
jgi:serralysin